MDHAVTITHRYTGRLIMVVSAERGSGVGSGEVEAQCDASQDGVGQDTGGRRVLQPRAYAAPT